MSELEGPEQSVKICSPHFTVRTGDSEEARDLPGVTQQIWDEAGLKPKEDGYGFRFGVKHACILILPLPLTSWPLSYEIGVPTQGVNRRI